MHIRYEDSYSLPGKHISFGFYIKEFRAETVDANGRPNFLGADEKVVYKLGVLLGANAYWNINDTNQAFVTAQPDKNKWLVSSTHSNGSIKF